MKVDSFIFSVDSMLLDCEVDFEDPIIVEIFLFTFGCALLNMEKGQMKFWLNDEKLTFNICWSMNHESYLVIIPMVNHIIEQEPKVSIGERLGIEALTIMMINFDSDGIDDYDELVDTHEGIQFHNKPKL